MATNPRDFAGVPPVTSKAAACVTQGIKIKGELSVVKICSSMDRWKAWSASRIPVLRWGRTPR